VSQQNEGGRLIYFRRDLNFQAEVEIALDVNRWKYHPSNTCYVLFGLSVQTPLTTHHQWVLPLFENRQNLRLLKVKIGFSISVLYDY
jgi:hypothetical protein